MPTIKKRVNFFESEEGVRVKQLLEFMMADTKYNTESSYSTDTDRYADNLIPFVDKHMNYINTHSAVDPQVYLANLRLMTKIR